MRPPHSCGAIERLGMTAWDAVSKQVAGTSSNLKRSEDHAGGSARGRVVGCAGRAHGDQRAAEELRLARQQNEAAEGQEEANPLAGMLRTQQHEAETADDDEQAQLEVLAAAQEAVPGPEVLGDGHGEQLDEREAEQQAAEIDADLEAARKAELPGPKGDLRQNPHRLRCFDSTPRRGVSRLCQRKGAISWRPALPERLSQG